MEQNPRKSFLYFFIEHFRFTYLLTFLLAFAGLTGLFNLQRETRPPVDFATVEIITPYPGASSTDVEDSVTRKIEKELLAIDGLKEVISASEAGLSTVTIKIEMDHHSIPEVVDEIQRAVQRVQNLPPDLPNLPRLERINVKEIPIVELALVHHGSEEAHHFERNRWAETLQQRLEDRPGVARVRLLGHQEREFIIELKTGLMQVYDISVTEVLEAVQKRTQNVPAGTLDGEGKSILVRTKGESKSIKTLQNIVIRSNASGTSIRIRDIASVHDTDAEVDERILFGGKAATLLTITKKESADAILAVENIRDEIEKFKSSLPEGFEVFIYLDEAERINEQLHIVVTNALTGLALVLFFLLIFLPGTIGFLTALSLPLSILGTIALMPLLGATFNTITMLAFIIAIGMLVDNAVVISENYATLRMQNIASRRAAFLAVQRLWLPITATFATTALAFIPMLVTKGVMGEFNKWIPMVVTLALGLSLVECFLLLPARIQGTIRRPSTSKKSIFDRVQSLFGRCIFRLIQHRYWVTLSIAALLIFSLFVAVKGTRFELFPKDQVETYYGRFEAPIGTSLQKTEQLARSLEDLVSQKLSSTPPQWIISHLGRQKVGLTDALSQTGKHVGLLTLKYSREDATKLSSSEILRSLREIDHPDLAKLKFDLQNNGPPVGQALSITLRSSDEERLDQVSQTFQQKLQSIQGIRDISSSSPELAPEYLLKIDEEKIAAAELDLETLGLTLRTALEGTVASTVSLNNQDVDTRIRFAAPHRSAVSDLGEYLVRNRTGRSVALKQVASFQQSTIPPVLKRRDFRRAVTITADLDPTVISSMTLNAQAEEILDDILAAEPKISTLIGGEQENTQESLDSLKQAMVLAALGILVVLVFLFRSFSVSFLILSSIPLGFIGIAWAFYLHGKPLSFMAMIGTIGLAGVVVNAAIVLVSFIEEYKSEGQMLNQVLATAASQRLRAVLVTSLTTVSGLIPTAYGLGGEDRLLMPMTLALAWGLVSGTALSLIWIPCGYAIIEDIRKGLRWFFGKFRKSVAQPTK